MANEIELNGLADINSLPDDWKISLINPATLQPAQNIKVAQFVESITEKMPVATSDTNGLFSSENSKLLSSLKYTAETSYDSNYILLMRTANYHYSQGCALIWAGNLSAYIIGPVCAVLKKESIPVLTSLDGNIGLTRGYYYRVYNDMLELYVKSLNGVSVSVTPLGNDGMFTYPMTVSNDPGGLIELTIQSSKSISAASNALTDTIQTSPVLESRQVRSTCLQNHLYQIILPTCQGRMDRMVQHQLEVNYLNSTFGRLTRSEKQYSNYKKKTRDLNKSSISTIARYNKCNLPRAGPPRLIN